MKIKDWAAFRQSLPTELWYGPRPHPSPTPASLADIEEKQGFRLPKSYCEYILVFGAGEFGHWLQIAAPACADLGELWDLEKFNLAHQYGEENLATYRSTDRERVSRLFFFAYNSAEDRVGWDLSDVTSAFDHEYGIYSARRDGQVERIAETFKALIELTYDFVCVPEADWDDEQLGPRTAFRPAGKWRK